MTVLIAENINVISKSIGPAIRERQAAPILELASAAFAVGMDYLDLNIGPARKNGAETMRWLVETVQNDVELPLSLDTTNAEAINAGLEASNQPALVNSVSMQPERLEALLPLVARYQADMIGLLWGTEGMPRDADERAMLAVELVYAANQVGIPNERIWIDPIVTPVSGDINQLNDCRRFLAMLPDIAPGCKSVVGLSNVSNGSPGRLRAILNRTYFIMLKHEGLLAAIVDSQDMELTDIARGRRPDIVEAVTASLEDERVRPVDFPPELSDYVKTVQVLTGRTLYSDSWLDI
ncbi:dihydropteroate synthase DHPS [Dehalogenimonas lykanthroporepellens BL-DC-9]|jgi:cobalamin-dependent methionine synthase I|nr:dihydropteroate synthase DHPS [Dehalogenimonas lykanthroporepellens BL-DC-9]